MLSKNLAIIISCLLIMACKSQLPINKAFVSDIETYREAQLKDLSSTSRSPLTLESAKRISFFPPDEKFKVLAKLKMVKPDETIQIQTYSGKQQEFIEYAYLTFELDGKTHKLTTHKNLKSMLMPMYKNKMFLMYMDLSTGESTYGGGRYIYLNESDIDNGQIILDFNKSFNPYCAYSDGFNCPIPPKGNQLDIAILAGEKDFQKK